MSGKKYNWHKVADSEADVHWAENGIAVVELAGKKVCVTRFQDKWFAFAWNCPHASGELAEGYIDTVGNIVCPVHNYKFSIRNGRNSSGEGYVLKTHPAELRPDGLFIGLEEGGDIGLK